MGDMTGNRRFTDEMNAIKALLFFNGIASNLSFTFFNQKKSLQNKDLRILWNFMYVR